MFLPKRSKTLDNLLELSKKVEEAAQTFKKLANDWEKRGEHGDKLTKIENQADRLIHKISDDIDKIFILPLDKEDIQELSETCDDLIDNLEQAANKIRIYRISRPKKEVGDFASLITKSAKCVNRGILLVRNHKFSLRDCYRELHDIEEAGDRLHQKVLEDIFGRNRPRLTARELFTLLKWNEIFDLLEDTLDRCEDMAILFERVGIKYK